MKTHYALIFILNVLILAVSCSDDEVDRDDVENIDSGNEKLPGKLSTSLTRSSYSTLTFDLSLTEPEDTDQIFYGYRQLDENTEETFSEITYLEKTVSITPDDVATAEINDLAPETVYEIFFFYKIKEDTFFNKSTAATCSVEGFIFTEPYLSRYDTIKLENVVAYDELERDKFKFFLGNQRLEVVSEFQTGQDEYCNKYSVNLIADELSSFDPLSIYLQYDDIQVGGFYSENSSVTSLTPRDWSLIYDNSKTESAFFSERYITRHHGSIGSKHYFSDFGKYLFEFDTIDWTSKQIYFFENKSTLAIYQDQIFTLSLEKIEGENSASLHMLNLNTSSLDLIEEDIFRIPEGQAFVFSDKSQFFVSISNDQDEINDLNLYSYDLSSNSLIELKKCPGEYQDTDRERIFNLGNHLIFPHLSEGFFYIYNIKTDSWKSVDTQITDLQSLFMMKNDIVFYGNEVEGLWSYSTLSGSNEKIGAFNLPDSKFSPTEFSYHQGNQSWAIYDEQVFRFEPIIID